MTTAATDAQAEASDDPDSPAPRGGLVVDVVREAGDWGAFEPVEEAVAAAIAAVAACDGLDIGDANAALALSDDASVQVLNRTYRGKDKPTNVLSFPALAGDARGRDQDDTEPEFLGDIVLAAQTVLSEARELEIPARHHLQHLVVHGVLHLLGFDHETDEEAAEMEGLETAILATLGIADPYAEAAGP